MYSQFMMHGQKNTKLLLNMCAGGVNFTVNKNMTQVSFTDFYIPG